MDRRNFIDKVSRLTGDSREQTSALLDALGAVVAEKCSEAETIALPGFGSFEPRKRLEREALHPATGRRILVPPRITLTFRSSTRLKQRLTNTGNEPQS